MLVSFFRNPVLLKVVGILVALAFLLPLIRYKHGLKIALPVAIIIITCFGIRYFLVRRRRRLSALEEEYLKKRSYLH
jgi:O-antigen/teichoic acid export membrane protein